VRSPAPPGCTGRSGRSPDTRLWVQAVVVLWSDFDEGVYEDDRCVVVHGSRLHEWISDRPDAVDEKAAGEIIAAIEAIANR
jgi:hypothetical protein